LRIRSTKPEFWKSRRIASVSWDARLVLKGLESYVDDNGVGVDDIELIVTDVFPRDMFAKGRETVARVSEAITELHQAGLVHRYEARGDRLLYISWWESIQRIDKPGKGRNPRPDGTFDYKASEIRESVASPPETLAPGTGEQRNRGTEEQGSLVPFRSEGHQGVTQLSQREKINLGSKVVNQFLDSVPGVTFPARIRSELAAHATASIQDGIDPAYVARGLQIWNEAGYPASTLPNSILQAQREATGGAVPNGPRPRRATGTERAIAGLTLAEQLAQEERNGEK
jgi:hypothetical protein